MIRGYLRLLTLKSLNDEPKSGYSLMKYIEKHLGIRPSPGSIYPLLDSLLRDGTLICRMEGKKKIYSLSQKGRAQLQQLYKGLEGLFQKMREGFNLLGELTGEDSSFLNKAIDSLRSGHFLFKEINPEIMQFRQELLRLLASGKIKSSNQQIKAVLKRAVAGLKKIK